MLYKKNIKADFDIDYENLKLNGKKIPYVLENPIDAVFISLGELIVDRLHDLNFTPNLITLISLYFGIFSSIAIINHYFFFASFLYLCNYILDCWDGLLARRYNLCTDFGDFFDHFKDYTVGAIILYVINFRLIFSLEIKLIFTCINIALFFSSIFYFSYQEKFYKRCNPKYKYSRFFSSFIPYFNLEPAEGLSKFKWLGTGTYTMFLCSFIILLKIIV